LGLGAELEVVMSVAMSFDGFQECVRDALDREPGARSWDVHFVEEERAREWMIIVVAGSAFASLLVPAAFATRAAASDIVRQLERMLVAQHGRPRTRASPA